jgi:hypothetical protein
MDQHHHGKLEVFVDSHLLEQAAQGNRQAIRDVAGLAEPHIRQLSARNTAGHDELVDFVARALNEIVEGATPNAAFRWSRRGRQPENKAFLEWNLAQHVKHVLPQVGGKVEAAIKIVGEAAFLDGEKGGLVEQAYHRWKDSSLPEDLFPLPPGIQQRLKQIEQRLPEVLRKFQQK